MADIGKRTAENTTAPTTKNLNPTQTFDNVLLQNWQ